MNALKNVFDLDGVHGAFVMDSAGEILLEQVHAVFAGDVCCVSAPRACS